MSLMDVKLAPQVKPEVRPDFVPVDAYVSPAYVQLEKEKLWPKTWLVACRVEEVKTPGQYVSFDIADESILILRTAPDTIKAYYNVCQHRGRRLRGAYTGNTGKVIGCPFHGWRYNLDGSINFILDETDWKGCDQFNKADLGLKAVRLDTWGGWVFVSMNPEIEPLLDYLSPIAERTAAYEFENTHIEWYHSVVVPCNWKVVVDAFNEAYHAFATHNMVTAKSPSYTEAYGKHGAFFVPTAGLSKENTQGGEKKYDLRMVMAGFEQIRMDQAKCMSTPGSVRAGERLKTLPDGLTDREIVGKWLEFHKEDMESYGAKWPDGLTVDYLSTVGSDYHIFPNSTFVTTADAVLWHRMRPHGDDPAMCVWDIYCLTRYAPGTEPPVEREFFASPKAFEGRNTFLEEDFSNMELVQKGMLSKGFAGARTSPIQEVTVSNFHKTLYDYLFDKN